MSDGPGDRFDVIVVGAGPAGSTTAAVLARAGRRVALLDAGWFPRDKLCGEFLSGESRAVLHELGCMDAIEAANPPVVRSMGFTAPGGASLDVALPAPASGVSRMLLDAVLFDRARTLGAAVFPATTALGVDPGDDALRVRTRTGMLAAPVVVAACGRSSAFEQALRVPRDSSDPRERAGVAGAPEYFGVKRHHLVAATGAGHECARALHGRGEIYSFRGGYCGVSCIEGQRVNVCALVRKGTPLTTWEDVAAWMSRANPALGRRLAGLAPCRETAMLAVAVPDFAPRPKVAQDGRALFVGDAGGMIAPLCGDGQAMALESGLRLGRLLVEAGEGGLASSAARAALGRAWEEEWDGLFGRRMRLGRALQALAFNPMLAGAALRILGSTPRFVDWLARATRGSGAAVPAAGS